MQKLNALQQKITLRFLVKIDPGKTRKGKTSERGEAFIIQSLERISFTAIIFSNKKYRLISKNEPDNLLKIYAKLLKFMPEFPVRFVQSSSSIFVPVAVRFVWECVPEQKPQFLCKIYCTTALECMPNSTEILLYTLLNFCAHKQQYNLSEIRTVQLN
jgi:hypothetical protein